MSDCRECGNPLLPHNFGFADGCACNSPRGVNHGLVPRTVCTCDRCDPRSTGSSRWWRAPLSIVRFSTPRGLTGLDDHLLLFRDDSLDGEVVALCGQAAPNRGGVNHVRECPGDRFGVGCERCLDLFVAFYLATDEGSV